MAKTKREKTKYPNIFRLPEVGRDVYEVRVSLGWNPEKERYENAQERFRGKLTDALKHQVKMKAEAKPKLTEDKSITMDALAIKYFENHPARLAMDDGTMSEGIGSERAMWGVMSKACKPVRFGSRKAASITSMHVAEVLNVVQERGITAASLNRYHTVLRSIMNRAIDMNIRDNNPVTKELKYAVMDVDREAVDQHFVEKMMELLPPDHADVFQLAFELTARRTEVLRLQVKHWNRQVGKITVRGTKNGVIRKFRPGPVAVEIIERRIAKLQRDGFVHPNAYLWSDDGGVTRWQSGRVTGMVTQTHKRICSNRECDYVAPKKRRGKVEEFCPECQSLVGKSVTTQNMRRHSATSLLSNGVNPKHVQTRGGWRNGVAMMRDYADDTDADHDVAIEALGRIWTPRQPSSADDSLHKVSVGS